jgi:hypothetical protein
VGKWFFFEQVLQVPTYVVFEPDWGLLEVYRLTDKRYVLEQPNAEGRHWCEALGLFLGAWQGKKEERDGYWLRWWNAAGELLPWAVERVEQERQKAEQERQKAEQERLRADRLAEALRAQGIDPDAIAQS